MWEPSRAQSRFYECHYMRKLGKALLACVLATLAIVVIILSINAAFGMDDGTRFENVPPQIRNWFRSIQSPQGVPCCDIADGHRTAWKADEDGTYWALIDSEYVKVPKETVILGAHNPTGESIVWYTKYPDGQVFIRCFVPADGA